MNQKTTTKKHTPYFDVVSFDSWSLSNYEQEIINVDITQSKCLFSCDQTCYIKAEEGIVSLMTSNSLEVNQIQHYILHGFIALKPNVYFNCLRVSSSGQYVLFKPVHSKINIHYVDYQLHHQPFTETLFIPRIYAFYVSVKKGPYYYPSEHHSYCELTIVDDGKLITQIDQQEFILHEKQWIIYGPDQVHTQKIELNQQARYVTVMFEMNPILEDLLNRTFDLNQSQSRLIQEILKITDRSEPLMEELVVSKFKEFILLGLIEEEQKQKPMTSMRLNYENRLIQDMITYINEQVYQTIQVTDLCEKFSISRTVVQELFNQYVSMSPKAYINKVKLERAKILLNESHYAISEISALLNYSTVHYFSKVFKKEFNVSPSEYAKSIIK